MFGLTVTHRVEQFNNKRCVSKNTTHLYR